LTHEYLGSMLGHLKRALSKNESWAGLLREPLGAIISGLRGCERAAEGKLARQLEDLLAAHGLVPKAQSKASVLERVLLEREGVELRGVARLTDVLTGAMVLPGPEEREGAASFPPDSMPEAAALLGAVNEMLARAPAAYRDEVEDKAVDGIRRAVAGHGLEGVAGGGAGAAAVSRRP